VKNDLRIFAHELTQKKISHLSMRRIKDGKILENPKLNGM
jgi:hypothetical protein